MSDSNTESQTHVVNVGQNWVFNRRIKVVIIVLLALFLAAVVFVSIAEITMSR